MKKALWVFAVLLAQSLSAQNVGIGTTNPQSTLDLKGNQRIGGVASYMTFDTLSGKIGWTNSNLFVPVTQFLMKHSAAGDGLYYNNSGGTTGQLEYRNALGEPVFFTNFTNGEGYFKSRLGVATVTPLAGLHVADSSVLFSASGDVPGFPGLPPIQGAGRRLQWYPDKAAFRAGFVDNDQWDQTNIGNYSFAVGNGTTASGNFSIALGAGTIAAGITSTALGNSTVASGDYTFAAGTNAMANGIFATAIGYNTIANGASATAMGSATEAIGSHSTAMGALTKAIGLRSTAMGDSTKASGDYSTSMGYHTSASGRSAISIGENTIASGDYSTAIGFQTEARSKYTLAIGDGTLADGYGSMAMGRFTIAKAVGSFSMGVYNDITDLAFESIPEPDDRIFQIGNGTGHFARSNAFTVLRNANVGIGVTDPPFRLSFDPLLGDKISLWSNSSTSYGFGVQSGLLQIHTDVSASNIAFGFGSSSSMTERMRIVNSGGTGMELAGRMVMKNGTFPVNNNFSPGIWFYKADNTELLGFIGVQDNQNLGFYGGPGAWGFVYDAIHSRVGIGTTSPAYMLDVTSSGTRTGNFTNTNADNNGIGVYATGTKFGVYANTSTSGTGDRYGILALTENGSSNNYGVRGIALGGYISYGVFGDAEGASYANWAGYFAGDVFAGTYESSDRKLKKDIQPLTNAMSIINQLHPAFYTFKTDEYKQMHLPEGVHYGLIADELLQVIPGIVKKAVQPAVYEHNDIMNGKKLSDAVEFNAVKYAEIISILVGAVKEQQSQLDMQQQQIEELKMLVEELRKK